MQYAPEFHTALITVSSIFMAIAGIIATILVSRENIGGRMKKSTKVYIQLVLGSIVLGILSITFALSWFSLPSGSSTNGAIVALLFQFLLMYFSLWRLINDPEKR